MDAKRKAIYIARIFTKDEEGFPFIEPFHMVMDELLPILHRKDAWDEVHHFVREINRRSG